eukprot:9594469-Karenia_brevis.AAC.1
MEHMREKDHESWKKIVELNKRSPDDTFTGKDAEHPPNSSHKGSSKEPNGTPPNPPNSGDGNANHNNDRDSDEREPKGAPAAA